MKNKVFVYTAIAVVVIGVLAVFTIRNSKNSPVTHNGILFCTTDGMLTDTMPIQSHRSYCIKSDSDEKVYAAKTPSEYSFSIVDDQGNALKDFAITHTKPMHVVIIRKDLKYFQHVHPEFNQSTGQFTLNDINFPTEGQYRIFADFAPSGGMKDPMGVPLGVTTSKDVTVGSKYSPELIGSEENNKTFDGYQISLATHGMLTSGAENMLMFNISQNGKPVTDLEPYLGALGHSVILREGTLDFIHAHPLEMNTQNGTVSFMVNFPETGKYKVFTQFQREGKVFTTDFVVRVEQGAAPDMTMPSLNHSMH